MIVGHPGPFATRLVFQKFKVVEEPARALNAATRSVFVFERVHFVYTELYRLERVKKSIRYNFHRPAFTESPRQNLALVLGCQENLN